MFCNSGGFQLADDISLALGVDGLLRYRQQTLSQYLVDRIRALPNVKVHLRTEVIALSSDTDNGLQGASFRNRDNGLVSTVPPRHLSLFIGADPNTDWLRNCSIALDAHDFCAHR